MSIENSLLKKVEENFKVFHMALENESHMHSAGLPETHFSRGTRETHFKLLLVSDDFLGASRIERQQKINALVEAERKLGLHALTMRLMTVKEFNEKGADDFISPFCASKS